MISKLHKKHLLAFLVSIYYTMIYYLVIVYNKIEMRKSLKDLNFQTCFRERQEMGMEELEEWTSDDIKYMKEALKQAEKAKKIEEVPIGCVIVYQGRIIGRI